VLTVREATAISVPNRLVSVKGHIKEAAGYLKEEANELGKSAKSKAKAQEGRNLRNAGRVEDGKALKTNKPGTDHLRATRSLVPWPGLL
jgi:hypothetical protein